MATTTKRTRRIERRERRTGDNLNSRDTQDGDYREFREDRGEYRSDDRRTTVNKTYNYSRGADVVYLMGVIGAAIFYLMGATDFWTGVLGILKALIWPVILVFEALNYFALSLVLLI